MATSAEENHALVKAVTTYNGNRATLAAFERFLADYPASGWRPSLLANLGLVYLQTGRPGKALQSWDAAWQATKDDTTVLNRAVADYALGNWLQLSTNMGRVPALIERLEEVANRNVGGQAGSKVAAAREGLSILQYHHELAAGSGPMALNSILRSRVQGEYTAPRALEDYHAMPAGASLTEMHALAGEIGLRMQMARVTGDGPVPVPSIVHLTTDHFSAVLEERAGRYRLRDVIFGGDAWVTREALLEESSGYFLVRDGELAEGWRAVSASEGAAIIGHCAPGYPDDEDPCPCGGPGAGGPGGGGNPPMGMPVYDFMPNRAGLRIVDIPVGYAPPKGPSVEFKLTYGQREALQPQIFTYWNAGPKWTFDWLSYVAENDGASAGTNTVHLRGGGREQFNWVTSQWRSGAFLVKTASNPSRYERRLQDGSVEVFAQPDGATTVQRRVFLTEIIDPRGDSLSLTYDSSLRLVAVTDALGQVTLLAYAHPTDPLKLTSVTDPFGRSALLTYNDAGQLASITDVIGLTSSFTYGPSDFVAAMTTPYGTTTFRHESSPGEVASHRMIEATDPLGGTERLEFHWIHSSVAATSTVVPTGFSARNASLDKYNTFYWDKRAWALHPGDVSKATIYHWLISPPTDPLTYHGASTAIPHSMKRPLENRVWYAYAGQSGQGMHVGTYRMPTTTARVLDDASTQVSEATYNSIGNITSKTDPLGRETSYTYATNDIDILETRQTSGSLNDLLVSYANYTSGHQAQSMTDPAAETSTFTYNSAGQILTITNPLSETTTYVYDSDGYVSSMTGPVTGAATTYAYDDYGRIEAVVDSDNYEVVTEYDALSRPLRMTYPDGTHEDITYDKLDTATRRDREGKVTRTFYDPLRRVTAVRDPLGRTITQQWCVCGSLDRLVDAKGQGTTWERDVQGRVTRELRADGTTGTDFLYETTTNRLKTVTDPKGQVATYAYASDDRLLQIAYTNEAFPTSDVSFTYEMNYPRLSTMIDGTGTTTYTYKMPGTGGAGQVASVDGPLTNDTITMTYDDLGRMGSRLINGYGISSLAYDPLGRLTQEQNVLGTFAYGYAGTTNRPTSVNYPNGQTSSYSYLDNAGDRRLQTIHHQNSAPSTISKFDYTYGPNGNILTWRQQAGADTVLWEYGYDNAEQLTSAVKKSTDPTPLILTRYVYAYDAAGNRTVEQAGDAVTGASYNNLNRLTSWQPNGVIRVTGTVSEAATVTVQGQPTRVSSGNLFNGAATITSGTSTFTISATDTNNNVTNKSYEVANSGSTKTFVYDANGNMTSDGTRTFEWDAENRLVALTSSNHRSEFSYDGHDRRVHVVERENSTIMTDARFVWAGDDIAEQRDDSGSTVVARVFRHGRQLVSAHSYVTRDHLMSIREVTDSSAAVQDRYEYDSYGSTTKVIGSDPDMLSFTGVLVHASSGLMLMKRRAYDTKLARWLSEDPLGMQDGPNLYSYVVNQPLRWIDPEGTALFRPRSPNGNISANFTPQNFRPICDVPGFFNWEEKSCVTECCKGHDVCYDNARCNWTSWLTIAYESSCRRCNITVSGCMAFAMPRAKDACLPCRRK